jgi:glycosyltransferase involved in cell wall biosynthesis
VTRCHVKIAHVSTFPEERCGIAIYVTELIKAIPHVKHSKYALHYGTNFSEDSVLDADVANICAVQSLARAISKSDCDLVSIQHEFGIWDGALGENIIPFLDELAKPIVSTLHTTFDPKTRDSLQTDILRRLVEQSSRVIVLTEASKRTVRKLGEQIAHKVVVIPHGVLESSFVPAPKTWQLGSSAGVPLSLITLGFFRRDKGIELVLVALWMLKRRGLRFSYLIAGEPQRQCVGQEEYLCDIRALVNALDLQANVKILDTFLTVSEQLKAIQNCHAGVFAYQDPTHASSGTIPLVLSTGRPVICTPFEYALSKQSELDGITISTGFSPEAIARAFLTFSGARRSYRSVTKVLYRRTRSWTWRVTGTRFLEEYRMAARHS